MSCAVGPLGPFSGRLRVRVPQVAVTPIPRRLAAGELLRPQWESRFGRTAMVNTAADDQGYGRKVPDRAGTKECKSGSPWNSSTWKGSKRLTQHAWIRSDSGLASCSSSCSWPEFSVTIQLLKPLGASTLRALRSRAKKQGSDAKRAEPKGNGGKTQRPSGGDPKTPRIACCDWTRCLAPRSSWFKPLGAGTLRAV